MEHKYTPGSIQWPTISFSLLQIVLIQVCQDAATVGADIKSADAATHNNQQDLEINLTRSDTVLLLATGRGGKAIRGRFTGAMADEFRKPGEDKDIIKMFERARDRIMKDVGCQKVGQQPECKETIGSRKLLLPPVTAAASEAAGGAAGSAAT